MIPQFTILAIAIIGAFIDGIAGFFVWGVFGYIGVMAFGLLLNSFSRGLLPRKAKEETATDFIAQYPDLIREAYPTDSPSEVAKKIGALLESMMKQATINGPATNLDASNSSAIFFPSAFEVAENQPTEELKILTRALIEFLKTHRHWYGQNLY